ncbi:hypothetical protein KIPB_012943, partial [Kipferlia bialata]|eukprot:g12943.t1
MWVLLGCLLCSVYAALECETVNPDFTDATTVVCPADSPELYGAFPLNYLVSSGVERFRPLATTVEAQS